MASGSLGFLVKYGMRTAVLHLPKLSRPAHRIWSHLPQAPGLFAAGARAWRAGAIKKAGRSCTLSSPNAAQHRRLGPAAFRYLAEPWGKTLRRDRSPLWSTWGGTRPRRQRPKPLPRRKRETRLGPTPLASAMTSARFRSQPLIERPARLRAIRAREFDLSSNATGTRFRPRSVGASRRAKAIR